MSRKSRRNRPDSSGPPGPDQPATVARRNRRRALVAGLVVAIVLAVLAVYALRNDATLEGSGSSAAALASAHAPTLGDASAKVHLVEFLDPACETCAQFYPVVKQLIDENPGKIRLSVRHVAFHEGSDYVVRLLEASRAQDKYWQTLEALLQTQAQWTSHHTVDPDRVAPAIAGVGLDMNRISADMASPAVDERVTRDRDDARSLKVTATPEYFVNGRPLPSFGYEQLLALVREELDRAY